MRTRIPALIGAALLIALVPLAVTNEFYLKVMFSAGMYYVAAAGLNVLVGWTGQTSLGHAGLFAAGAYTAAILTAQFGWNPWLALLAAAVVAAIFGVVIALPSLRVSGPSLAMVTIGFGILVERVITEWQVPFGGQEGIADITGPRFAGAPFTMRAWVWLTLGIALVTHVLISALLAGKYGRAFQAVRTGEIAAKSVGVNVYRVKVLAFVVSAVTCRVAGALMAQQNQYINSDFINFNLSVFLLLIVLFGGPSVIGPALGAVCMTLLDAFLARWPGLQHFTYGALLLFALYAMPNGLAGALTALARRFLPRYQLPPTRATSGSLSAEPAASRQRAEPRDGVRTVLLRCKDLYKAYGGVVTTNDIDLELREGHVHALIGPNGAGKTTLLNLLSGVIQSDRGSIVFDGQDVTGWRADQMCRAGIGRTFQNLKLFPEMTVLENVMVGLHPHLEVGFWPSLLQLPAAGQEEGRARAEAISLLEFVGLLDRATDVASSLPYGLQRRLELARALATRPRLLMLDEPAAGLNPQETDELTSLILRLGATGLTILLIEHHMDLVMEVSDHVVVLDYGSKIFEGSPDAVQRDERVIRAYLGEEDVEEPIPAHSPLLLQAVGAA